MDKKIKVYKLGLIPIVVRTKEDAKKAGEYVQNMVIKIMESEKNDN